MLYTLFKKNKINRKIIIMKFRIPQKSLFGFKVLNCFSSLIFSYLFIILFLISGWFSNETFSQELAKNLYIFISNFSFLVLLINSFYRRREISQKIFLSIIFPLIIFLPFSIINLIFVMFKFFSNSIS